jgi:hypothetical protein
MADSTSETSNIKFRWQMGDGGCIAAGAADRDDLRRRALVAVAIWLAYRHSQPAQWTWLIGPWSLARRSSGSLWWMQTSLPMAGRIFSSDPPRGGC